MTRWASPILALGAAAILSGCVAAAIPVIAGAALGRQAIRGKPEPRIAARRPEVVVEPGVTFLPLGSELPAPTVAPSGTVAVPPAPPSAGSADAWSALVRFTAENVLKRPADSAVLAPGATPAWIGCGEKPLAVVFDVELQGSPAPQRAIDALYTMGVAVVFLGGRPIAAAQRAAAGKRYCVLAIAGDEPEDFSDTADPSLSKLGAGWFLAPAISKEISR